MSLLDRVTDVLARIGPAKRRQSSRPMGAGIGHGGHGMVPFGDDVSFNSISPPWPLPRYAVMDPLRNHVGLSAP
jgi:hypothetical protein